MNISNLIKQAKGKVEEQRQARTKAKVKHLQELRTKRIKLEGKAKIMALEQREKERLKQAKEKIKKNSKIYRTVQELKKLKQANDKRKMLKEKNKTTNDYWGGGTGKNVF